MDSQYLALWRRNEVVVAYYTEQIRKLGLSAKRSARRRRRELLELADYIMMDFYCCMGQSEDVTMERVLKELERHVEGNEKLMEEYRLKEAK